MNRKQKAKRFKKEDNIYRPMTPHESRLASYTCPSVPPEDSLEGFILKRKMEKDIGFKILMRKIEADINFIRIEAALGGSGLYMSKLLGGYIHEFYHRFNTCGPKGFPLSFNILEAFFNFEHLPAPFKLHREYEHLLKLEDFLIWGQKKGLKDVLLINESNHIIESTNSNFFIVSNGVLYTPSLSSGCVGGTMRMKLINIALENGIKVYESNISPGHLLSCDEIILTNAIQGIKWVRSYKSKRYFHKTSDKLLELLNNDTTANA